MVRRLTIVSLLCLLFLQPASAQSEELPRVQTYDELVRAIREIRQATNPENKRERVLEAWTIGKLIDLHAAEYRLWKDYPAYLFENLSKVVNLSYGALRHMRNFARIYPEQAPSQDLDWWHYQAIMYVPGAVQREALAVRDEKEKWTSDKLQAELKKLREKNRTPAQEVPTFLLEKLNHYRATVTSVVDGDTFEADVDLGFGLTAQRVFRLRGVDAPEMGTEEGIAAKRFLVDQMGKSKGRVILKATEHDQYGRYLADVWIPETGRPKGVSLNQKLVDEGLAEFDSY